MGSCPAASTAKKHQAKEKACPRLLFVFCIGFNQLKNNCFILRSGGKQLFKQAGSSWWASLPFDPTGILMASFCEK